MLTFRTHDIKIFGGMNGKLASEICSGNESPAEGKNDEISVPNYHYRD